MIRAILSNRQSVLGVIKFGAHIDDVRDASPYQGRFAVPSKLGTHKYGVRDAAIPENWNAGKLGQSTRVSPERSGADALRAKPVPDGTEALRERS